MHRAHGSRWHIVAYAVLSWTTIEVQGVCWGVSTHGVMSCLFLEDDIIEVEGCLSTAFITSFLYR